MNFLEKDLFWDYTIPPMEFQAKEISMYDNEFILRALEYRRRRHSFLDMLEILKDNKELICAEIGTWTGENAKIMLRADKRVKLYTIDGYSHTTLCFTGDVMSKEEVDKIEKTAEENLTPYGERRVKVRKQSEEAYKDFPDEYFDYIYIDGDHHYKTIKNDINIWYPKLKKGGVMGGHDWADEYGEVKKAVLEFKEQKGIGNICCDNPIPIHMGFSDWWFVK